MTSPDVNMICQRWHKAVGYTSGTLVYAIVKSKMNRDELRMLSRLLAQVAKEMKRLADGKDVSDLTGFINPKDV